MGDAPLQWHPAFRSVMEIELEEEREYLQFLREYNLTKKPLQIDLLIIKMQAGRRIQKNLGQLFRQYNIVEYKSPEDYLSINDFYKVTAYACLYQSDTEKIQQIRADEVTITLVSDHFPKKMVEHIREEHGAEIVKQFPGIYYVNGLMFPMQILVNRELSKSDNVWLSRLRENLTAAEDMGPLADAYAGKENNPLYASAMDAIIRANKDVYEEGMDMCDALYEIIDRRNAAKVAKMAEERAVELAEKLAEERAVELAEELAEKLAEERAVELAEELAEKLAEELAEKLAEERIEKLVKWNYVEFLCWLFRKGVSSEEIADIFEEPIGKVSGLYEQLRPYAPEYNLEEIKKAFDGEILTV